MSEVRHGFPEDFMFQLTLAEAKELQASWSQNVTLKRGQNVKYRPYAFTEYGALMAANILNSAQAVQMSIFVVRAFAKMREALRRTPELTRKLAALEKRLTARLDVHEAAIVEVLKEVMQILNPPPEPEPPRRKIGFHEYWHLKIAPLIGCSALDICFSPVPLVSSLGIPLQQGLTLVRLVDRRRAISRLPCIASGCLILIHFPREIAP
jgi:ORF6N domain